MAISGDFQDSIMFGDEAAHIPTAMSGPKLCKIEPLPYAKPGLFSSLWMGLTDIVTRKLPAVPASQGTKSKFADTARAPAAKPVAAAPLAYNSLGLPKPE